MSSRKNTNSENTSGAPKPENAGLVKSLNKIYKLYRNNESAVSRLLGLPPQYLNRWRKGEHRPNKAAIKHIAETFNTTEENLLSGDIGQPPEPYSKKGEKLIARFEDLIERADTLSNDKLIAQIADHLDLIELRISAAERETANKSLTAQDLNPSADATVRLVEDVSATVRGDSPPDTTPEDTERQSTPRSATRDIGTPPARKSQKRHK